MPYIPHTDADRRDMLDAIGASSVEELFHDVPESFRFPELKLPKAASEMEILDELYAMALKNSTTGCMASCTLTIEELLVGKGSLGYDPVIFIIDPEKVFIVRYKPGKNVARYSILVNLAHIGDQFYLETLLLCILYIEFADMPDTIMENFGGIHDKSISMSCDNIKLELRIPAINIQ